MNRIILIGNGFDLAHSLPTRYEDFINWYWNLWLDRLRICHDRTLSDGLCTFSIKFGQDTWYSLLWQQDFTFNLHRGVDFVNTIISDKKKFEVVQSHLLYRICKSIQDKKWVDIENEYYCLLKEAISNPEKYGCSPQELNNQLQRVLNLLTQYLGSLQLDKVAYNDSIRRIIYEPINIDNISITGLRHYYGHCNNWANYDKSVWENQMSRYGINGEQASFLRMEIDAFLQKNTFKTAEGKVVVSDYNQFPKQFLRPDYTLLLSFNYTGLTDAYSISGIGYAIHIHGDLRDPQKMIFGYGDELDEDYKNLLKQTDNECLRNIKSIKYLESNNYRNMLHFIESVPYQVYVMGHSCGNSDRTLLNTLFEHKNCVSIKPYYYQKEDGSDNYLEIVQNICRNFTDMKLMRDRVVNKTYCEPLPQFNK